MKKFVYFLLVPMIFCNCTHKILRSGYAIQNKEINDCNIAIVRSKTFADTIATKIGEIKLGDTGFSVTCSEQDAISILKKEGCSIGADIINIKEESRSDIVSTCYRCRAEFYKYASPNIQIKTDSDFLPQSVENRVADDKQRNTIITIIAVAAGLTFGLLLF